MAASTALQVLVSPFLGTLFDNLSSLIQSEFSLIRGVNKEMEKLSNTLATIRDVLDDAEDKQITDKTVVNWLRKLKEVVYDAEDVLDECAFEALTPESQIIENTNCSIQVITDSVSSCFDFKRNTFRHTIGKRIKKVREKFDEIAEESKFHLNLNSIVRDVDQRETTSFLAEPQVYGRDMEKEYLVNLLLNNVLGDNHQAGGVSICPILGMGGLGKTTLAQMVIKDERIVRHFDLKCWVCVSEDFNLKALLNAIVVSCGEIACEQDNLDHLQHRLQEILSGKKFLLVLDDVWSEDQDRWYKLKSSLACGSRGSCSIIVTTRLETVASLMGTLPVCHLKFLSNEDCFSLFMHRAFAEGEGERHPNLESIGKEIVKKCGGVPLAAKALGGLLRFKREEQEWVFVRDSNIWDLHQDKDNAILPALRLSYNHLPSHLRQCFAYCSIFPKDHKMKKEVLIHLWLANGFVQPKGNMELEDIGNEIFSGLLWRSFFQDVYKDKDGNIEGCKMHDLVHDLACSITGNECYSITGVQKEGTFGRSITRHVSISDYWFSRSSSTGAELFSTSNLSPMLRTFLRLNHNPFAPYPPQLSLSYHKYLRVLDLSTIWTKTLPVSIGNLKHLRYLDLSNTIIVSLPNESFCRLRNLQTLKLFECKELQMLPEDTGKLINLRHLDITGCDKLTEMPVGMGQLKCLRTLSVFIVGKKIGCGIGELKELDRLRGELTIKCLQKVKDPADAKNANLIGKQNLRSLELSWSFDVEEIEYWSSGKEEDLAEGLQPHPNIRRLKMLSYKGLKFPSWIMNSTHLPNLVEISLDGCSRCEYLPPLGLLPHLKSLYISGLASVKCIVDEFYHGEEEHNMMIKEGMVLFPSLEKLVLHQMLNLEEWKGWSSSTKGEGNKAGEVQVVVFPFLESLDINVCPRLRTFPPLPLSIQQLKMSKCSEKIVKRALEGMVFKKFTSLQSLEIEFCIDLKSLQSLKSFYKALQHLTTLVTLCIYDCPELELSLDDFQNLVSLEHLKIRRLPKLRALPFVGSQHLAGSALEEIDISECSGLMTLPELTNHTFLRSLRITHCKNLKLLPDGLQHLTSLLDLEIRDCHPDLHRRCKKNAGEDWHKIAHIPRVHNYSR